MSLDNRISDILAPLESRMYAIQIQHADWLRENRLHLVSTGPAHETHGAIIELVRDAFLAGYAHRVNSSLSAKVGFEEWSL